MGLIFFWPFLGGKRSGDASHESAAAAAASAPTDAGREALIKAAAEAAQACVLGRWDLILERARTAAEPGSDRLHLFVWTLFTAFDALETDDHRGALRAFFESGRDVRFGELFTVGAGGWLMDWPTLRVALFDYVSQRDPELAREIAVGLLQARPEEPGEWALALRELVRGRPYATWDSLARVRLQEFIHDPAWAAHGAAGWMEGFDLVVAIGTPEPLADLAALSAQNDARSARFVAFLTADRLVMAAPAPCLAALNQDPSLFSGATGVRAGLFARCDVRDPAQVAELEAYFLRGDVGPGERAQFAAAFPQLSAAPTHRLLTTPVVRSEAEIHAAEASTLALLATWIESARYPTWTPTFVEIQRRLQSRVTPAPATS